MKAATLFDVNAYHQELPPSERAPYRAEELLTFIAQAEAENDGERLFKIFSSLMMHCGNYTDTEYRRVFKRHEKASKAVSQGDRPSGNAS